MDIVHEPWSWPAAAAELAPMLDKLEPHQAMLILRALVAEPNPAHLAPLLSGMIRGHVARNDTYDRRWRLAE